MSDRIKTEICVNSVEAAVQAQKLGASRVILCAGDAEWGLTPSFGAIRIARQHLDAAELHVAIRPHDGGYVYSPIEQEVMLHDVKVARQLGANGVVFGCLTPKGEIDVPTAKSLLNAVGDMQATFNLAFALCSNPDDALAQLASIGLKRVEMTVNPDNLEESLKKIAEWNEQHSKRLTLVLGEGLAADMMFHAAEQSHCRELHLTPELTADMERVRAELEKLESHDAALEKLLKEAKAKKKKGRRSEDDDEEDL
jgi:copper homeostasis protein